MKKNTQPKVKIMDTFFKNKRILSFLVATIVLLSTFPLGVIISNAATVEDFTITVTDDNAIPVPISGATVTFKNSGSEVFTGTTDVNGKITVYEADGLDSDIATYTIEVSASGYVSYSPTAFVWAAPGMSNDRTIVLETEIKTYKINTSVISGNGTITGSSTVASGAETTVTVEADSDEDVTYRILSLTDTVGGISKVVDDAVGLDIYPYTIPGVSSDHTIEVVFEQVFEILTTVMNEGEGGTITASLIPTTTPAPTTTPNFYFKGQSVEIKATASLPGYQIDWMKDNEVYEDSAQGQTEWAYTVIVNENHEIEVAFDQVTLTASVINDKNIVIADNEWTNTDVSISGSASAPNTHTTIDKNKVEIIYTNLPLATPTPACTPYQDELDANKSYDFTITNFVEGKYTFTINLLKINTSNTLATKDVSFGYDITTPLVAPVVKTPGDAISNSTVTLTGSVTDWLADGLTAGSGVSEVRYSSDETAFLSDQYKDSPVAKWPCNNGTFQIEITEDCDCYYYVWAYDDAGNKSNLSLPVPVHIDTVAPTVGTLTKAPSETATNQAVTVTCPVSDNVGGTGISSVRYGDNETVFDSDSYGIQTGISAAMNSSATAYEFTVSGDLNKSYYVWAYDNAGNKSTISEPISVHIDTVLPSIIVNSISATTATNQEVVVQCNATDDINGSGVFEVRYSYNNDGGESIYTNDIYNNSLVETADRITGTDTFEFTISDDCNGIYNVWAYDNAGNKSAIAKTEVIHIDTVIPGITSVTKSPSTDWSAGAVTLTVNATDNDSGIVSMFCNTSEDKTALQLTEVTAGSKYTITTPNNEFDGTYYFWAVDAAGNVSELTPISEISVSIDKTKPFIKSLAFSVDGISQDPSSIQISDYGYFFPKDTTVTITAQDDALSSGIKSITYYTVSEGIQSAEVTQNVVDNKITFVVKANFKGWIFAKATDMVGNVTSSYIKPTAGVIVEDAAKHLETSSISLVTPATTNKDINGLALYSGNVLVDVTVTDTFSGIDTIEWSVESAYDAKQSGTTHLYPQGAITADTTGWTVAKADKNLVTTLTKTLTVSNDSNAIKVYVKLTDRAGNTSEKYITFSIDKTAPAMNLTYDNNSFDPSFPGEYELYKADRTATIVVTERNFSAADFVSAITNTDGVVPSISGWTESKNTADPDKTTHTAQITYSADGDYTFDMQFKDLADLQAAAFATDKFTIDKTLPVVQVSYNNNDAKNTNYFSKERTASITINEHNFETGRIILTGTATDGSTKITFPAISSWTTSGDTHTASIRYEADANYSFDISYVDKAGNATLDFPIQNFYIDKTAPGIVITGVMDKSANKGDVIPVISLTDTNFDKDTVVLTLKGANQGDTTCKGSFSDISNGEKFTFDNFGKTKAVDDIYTLTAKAIDSAGNETTSSITFSVNRFGSVYVFGETLKSITGKYVQRCTDVTITESNVDELAANKTKVKITKNGEQIDLTEGTDYTVKHTGGNGGWSQYSYVLAAMLFEDDAKYVITLYSEDAAGNINENIDEAKKSEIWFGVDKTLPVIIATDLSSGKTYAVESKIVAADISDNLVLDSVKIFIDGAETEVSAENGVYTFTIPGSNSAHQIKITATDSAGNELVKEFKNVYVTTNLAVRWFTNTPLFVGSIALIVVLVIALAYFILFPKRRIAAKR